MGLSGSSMTSVSTPTDSSVPECPMHKKTPDSSSSAAVSRECPASFVAGQPAMSDADIDPANMVSN